MPVVVNVVGNFDDKELKRAQRELGKLGSSAGKTSKSFNSSFRSMTKAAVTLGVALGAAKIVDFAKNSVQAASALQESLSKTSVVFGKNAAAVEDWANKNAISYGLSKQAALEAAGTYGNLFQAFGVNAKASEKMSTSLVELAGDLASFNNTSVDDALVALRSGLSGETEPLKRYGVALSDVRLKQQALEMGLISSTKDALTPGAKAQAAYALVMKDTTLAQGDAIRTADSYANVQRRLQATVENLKASVGGALLPVISKLAESLVPIVQNLAGPVGDILNRLAVALSSAFNALLPVLKPLQDALIVIVDVVGNALANALKTLVPAFTPVLNILSGLVAEIAPMLAPILAKVAQVLAEILRAVMPLLGPLARLIVGIFKQAAPILDLAIDAVLSIIKALKPLFPVIARLLQPLGRLVFALLKAIMPILRPLLPIISKLADLFAQELADTINLVTDALNALLPWIEKALKWIGDFAGGIVDAFGNFPDSMLDVGKNIVVGIWNGIVGVGSWFKDKIVEWAGNMLPGWVKDVLGIQSPSRVFMEIGKFIPAGMAAGIEKAAGSVKKAAQEMGKTAIDAATEALQAFKEKAQAFFDLRDQIRDAMKETGNLGSLTMGDGFAPNAAGVTGYLADRLRRVKEFGKQLAELKALHLNNASLQQIIAAGPDAGGQIAAALLAEGRKAVSEVNTLEAQLNVESTRVGAIGAESQFGMTSAQARGMRTTNVTLKDGAVVVNFGAGIGAKDAADIEQTIHKAIKKALVAAAQDAKR